MFEREIDYGAAMALAKEMLGRGLVTRSEYAAMEKLYADRFQPLIQRMPYRKPDPSSP
jgi:hypothetical protein